MNGRFLLGISLALGLVASTLVMRRTLLRWKAQEILGVTGSARRRVKADSVTWTLSLTVRADGLSDGYGRLDRATRRVGDWLEKHTLPRPEASSVQVREIFAHGPEGRPDETHVVAWTMAQSLTERTKEIDKVAHLNPTELIAGAELAKDGVVFASSPPVYRFTALEATKLELLAEASQNARARAAKMAAGMGARVGELRRATFGDITITSDGTIDRYSDDAPALEKSISADVHAEFEVN
jgi:hypothetical protein